MPISHISKKLNHTSSTNKLIINLHCKAVKIYSKAMSGR